MNQDCRKTGENDEVKCLYTNMWSQSKRHNFQHDLWNERYKEKETGSKALYIDIDENEENEEGDKEYSEWSELPDLLLEKIFSYLGIRKVLCKFGVQKLYVLDHLRCQMCLSSVGKNFKHLTIQPMLNFYNLYEFMNILSWYTEQRKRKENVELGIGNNIAYLKFTFPCNMTSRGETFSSIKKAHRQLKEVKMVGTLTEAQYLLDEICETCCLTLRCLHIINTTRVQYQMLHVGVFLNLYELVISPQNLGDDLVELLGYTKLEHLHILQNRYTPYDAIIKPVSPNAWQKCRQNNSALNVHLQVESLKEKPLIWQERAPVRTVLFDSPHIRLRTDSLMTALEFYRDDLRIYGHKNIPRFHRSKCFSERIDEPLLMLVQMCTYLSTLAAYA
ncbi:hypothetical protein NQ317_011979, partial [Molorchus minor]